MGGLCYQKGWGILGCKATCYKFNDGSIIKFSDD